VCSASDSPSVPDPLDDPACGQLDLDFGASPNLFRDAAGNVLVGELQKSGVYRVAHADSMKPAWTQLVGLSCQACNAGSTAFDGNSVLGVGAPGGELFSLDRSSGSVRWASPVGDGVHYQSTSAANGVAYTVDGSGFLDANDAATGAVLLHRQTSTDAGTLTGDGAASNGLAIAEGSVFAALTSASSSLAGTTGSNVGSPAGAYLIAHRLPG
jgi:outer membrane protein assembly factor BamB